MPSKKKPQSPARTRAAKSGLTELGKGATQPSRKLEAFPNNYPDRETTVTLTCTEFTCLCPITGQPDFGTIEITYVPGQLVLESKSLKLYLWTYREVGIFHEDVVNELADALYRFLNPRWIQISGQFNVRGGIGIEVTTERGDEQLF
jgi:7-cyano-7-deazaguanine reductase